MEILLVLLAIMVVMLAATMGSIAFGVWALRRHNRVSPSVPTTAPLVWLCSPSRPARTHRRLRTSAASARRVPRQPDAPDHSRSALSTDLERQAVDLDEWVLWTSRAPSRWRRDHYRAIDEQVRLLEGLTMRLSDLGRVSDHPPATAQACATDHRRNLGEAAERLAQLEQAHAEVEALERLTLGTAPLAPPATTPARSRSA